MARLLTDRQGDVLRLLCAGRTTRQIAADLGLAVVTVKNYRAQLRERLAPLTVAEACARLGLPTGPAASEPPSLDRR